MYFGKQLGILNLEKSANPFYQQISQRIQLCTGPPEDPLSVLLSQSIVSAHTL